jgi:hypothetical protein
MILKSNEKVLHYSPNVYAAIELVRIYCQESLLVLSYFIFTFIYLFLSQIVPSLGITSITDTLPPPPLPFFSERVGSP